MDITPGKADTVGFALCNDKGEKVDIYLDMKAGRVVMDRTQSGITDLTPYGEMTVHDKETDDHRKTLSVNYVNDFALGTWAPLSLCNGKSYHLDIFVDKCSIEIFRRRWTYRHDQPCISHSSLQHLALLYPWR